MEALTYDRLGELSALATILAAVIIVVWKGIPLLIAYLERKDNAHREEIKIIMAENREDRNRFYEQLTISLGRIHDRLDKIETSIVVTKNEQK